MHSSNFAILEISNYIIKKVRKIYICIISPNKNLLIFTPQIN